MAVLVPSHTIRERSVLPSLSKIELGFSHGHVFKKFCNGVANAGKKCWNAARKVIVAVGEVRNDASAFGHVLKIGGYVCLGIERLRSRIGSLAGIASKFSGAYAMVDTLQIFDAIGFFFSGEVAKSHPCKIIGNLTYLCAGMGGITLLLNELSVISLSGIAASLGSVPVLGAVVGSGIGLSTVVIGTVGVAFAFFLGEAIHRAVKAAKENNHEDKKQACIDIAWCATEVAFKSFLVASQAVIGYTSVPVLIGLGGIASVLGITSFLNRKFGGK